MTDRLITIEQQIAAPRADVWRVLADFPNIADWNSGVKVSRATSSATGGIGATRHCDLIPAGGLDETVTDWQDEQRLVISIDKAQLAKGFAGFLVDLERAAQRTDWPIARVPPNSATSANSTAIQYGSVPTMVRPRRCPCPTARPKETELRDARASFPNRRRAQSSGL